VTQNKISERVKQFIFSYVDSVELLEVLFLLRANPNRFWSTDAINDELRSSLDSIKQRINSLRMLQLIQEDSNNPNHFHYSPNSSDAESLITELWNAYQTNRFTIFELIFSPLKKARAFANAFRMSESDEKKEKNNG
jgi:hypothetical protein